MKKWAAACVVHLVEEQTSYEGSKGSLSISAVLTQILTTVGYLAGRVYGIHMSQKRI